MCGIAGICHLDGRRIDERVLEAMGELLAHRGPDGQGTYVDGGAPSVGLASRRLAVVDIAGGSQPMSIDDGAVTIVYNGELFNAHELRGELRSRGRRFATHSDTEVILHGYAQWGTDVLSRLNGMWAFAIWDRARRRLFVSRDRLGVKPLVYAMLPRGIAFASEIKALTGSGVVARRLDPAALPHYLSFFAIPEPHTLVAGVRRLPAGHALVVDAAGVRESRWWDCALEEEEDRGFEAYSGEVAALLEDSVTRRLVSDVPLGVLLSGGVDSRLVATLARRHRERLDTFTLGFNTPAADERAPARAVAAALHTQHTDELADAAEAARAYPALLVAYDEPGQSLVQTHLIARMARRDVTVALSGLGGDELYAAYPTHVVVNMLARLDPLPPALRATVIALAGATPGRRGRTLHELASMPADRRASAHLLHQTSAALRGELLSSDVRASVNLAGPIEHLEGHFERARGRDPLNRLLYVYLKTYLADELLRATDAMSMLHGLEVRTPFLDYRLVEHAMRMPARHKMQARRGKLVLRAVAARTLPGELAAAKRGFAPPLRAWLAGPLREQVRELLDPAAVTRRGVFDAPTVKRVLAQCLAGDDRMIAPVMMCFSFEAWARGWLDGGPQAAGRAAAATAITAAATTRDATAQPDLSVAIVNWNTRERLRACLASLQRHLPALAHEVIVVDNASHDGSAEMVKTEFPSVRVIRNADNAGFGRANNQAMRAARGRWLLLLNSDTELIDDSVARLLSTLDAQPDGIGVAHCRLLFPDGRPQHTVYRFPDLGLVVLEALGLYKLLGRRRAGETLLGGYWDYARERDVDWVAGSFMLMPRAVFEQTGGFDERLFMYGEDLEWCYRISDDGWRVRYYPTAQIVHFDHCSSDLMWGQRPVALCLQTERDVLARRYGPGHARAVVAARLAGATLREAYYGARARGSGDAAEGYASMREHATTLRRALTALARGAEAPATGGGSTARGGDPAGGGDPASGDGPLRADYHDDPRPDLQALIQASGRRVLDVGCGAGALGAALKAAGAAYVAGIEAHAPAAARARERLDLLIEGDVLDPELRLPFAAGELDYLIFADVLEHLTDPGAALRRLLPYLAADGRVVVSVPNMRFYLSLARLALDRWSYTDAGVRDRTHVRIMTHRLLLQLLAEHGLEAVSLQRHHRLFEDQSQIGRIGAGATRLARVTIAPLAPNLLAYQYVVVARRRA